MRALYLTDHGPAFETARSNPSAQVGNALIRVRLVGICATDLELIQGYKGGFRGVLGHEFVGEVIAAPGATEWVGKRVVGEINIGCGECSLCRRGMGKHCRQRQCLGLLGKDGAMAEFVTLPVANLHAVPDEVSDEQAVFVEPLAAALEILEQVRIGPSSRVYLVGDGRLGMLIAQVLALTGCDLTILGRHAAHLALLEKWHGSKTLISTPEAEALLAAEAADVVVEATGSPSGFDAARRLVRPGGTLVLKSTFAGDSPPVDLSHLVVDEVTVVGSRCGPFAPALRLLASNRVHVLPMIEARYPLEEAVAALAHAGQRGVLKVLVAP
jgi:threonine dehydrogenase-like Zn-dependent dehydrogenase